MGRRRLRLCGHSKASPSITTVLFKKARVRPNRNQQRAVWLPVRGRCPMAGRLPRGPNRRPPLDAGAESRIAVACTPARRRPAEGSTGFDACASLLGAVRATRLLPTQRLVKAHSRDRLTARCSRARGRHRRAVIDRLTCPRASCCAIVSARSGERPSGPARG